LPHPHPALYQSFFGFLLGVVGGFAPYMRRRHNPYNNIISPASAPYGALAGWDFFDRPESPPENILMGILCFFKMLLTFE